MLFLHPWLLLGLTGIGVPIVLHLFNRRKSRTSDWGALRFLEESINQRRRRVLLEEILLLVTRCLILACAALIFARPFLAGHASVSGLAVLTTALLAIIAAAVGVAIWNERVWRRRLWITAACLALLAVVAVLGESWNGWRRFGRSGTRDIAIILDGSSSMTLEVDGLSNFARAVKEAQAVIESAPRACAFTLIIGGTVPHALTPAPVTDRKHLLRLLDDAVPDQGTFHALDALALAVTSLARGSHGNKQILVIGDGQSVGWQLGETEVWSYLGALLERLPTQPRIVWRTLEMPGGIRNLTVADLAFSRQVIGTDREVRIDVTIANNGGESATAQALRLTAGDRTYTDTSIGQLQPGETRVVSFRHRFTRTGTQPVTASLAINDEMPSDNTTTRIAPVRGSLRVLVVEGGRAPRLAERPGAFVALALSPSQTLLARAAAREADPRAQPKAQPPSPPPKGFVVPELITLPDFIARERLDDFAAVILADVPRMPSNTAARLLQFVERGGGLLALHGSRSDSAFYNGWQTQEQHPVMPLALDEAGLTPAVREPVMVDTLSIIHPALQPLAPDSDIATTGFIRHWPATAASARTRIGARLFNGQPLLADHTVGKGRILQWTAPVDPAAGNLVSRQSFLPLMHELVYYLASPVVPDLNLPPMRGATLSLGSGQSEAGETSENGLRALYYRGTEQREALLARTDPQINFNWGQKGPAPGLPAGSFNTVWTGSLKVPVSGRYRLFTRAEGDMTVQIDAGLDSRARAASSLRIDLDATRRHDLVVRYTSVKNRASANLLWEGPGIGARHVPATALSPVRVRSDGWSETHETRVYPPRGEPLEALLQQSQDTLALHIPHRLTPGLYRAEVPAVWVPLFRDLAVVSNGMAQITFCVATDGNESRLATVTPDEAAFTRRYADLVLAATADEMHRALGGGATGRELWRPLAVALFFLLLAETILTRWIAIQRKTGAEALPVFDEPAGPSAASFRATMGTLNRSQP